MYAKLLIRLVLRLAFSPRPLSGDNVHRSYRTCCNPASILSGECHESSIPRVNYFFRESISRHLHPAVRVRSIYATRFASSGPRTRTTKIFMCADIGVGARADRSHRAARNRRGPINIGSPGQIASWSRRRGRKKEKRKKGKQDKKETVLLGKRAESVSRATARPRRAIRAEFPQFSEIAPSLGYNRARVCACVRVCVRGRARATRSTIDAGGSSRVAETSHRGLPVSVGRRRNRKRRVQPASECIDDRVRGNVKWKESVRYARMNGAYTHVEARRNIKWMLLRWALAIVTGKSRRHGRIARFKFINVRAVGPTMVARLPQQVLLLLVLGE